MQDVIIEKATIDDAERMLKVQKKAFESEAEIYARYKIFSISPMRDTVEDIQNALRNNTVFYKAVYNEEIIGSIRALMEDSGCMISRLNVDPAFQNRRVGTSLLNQIEELFKNCNRFELYVGSRSDRNIIFYSKRGYKIFKTEKFNDCVDKLYMEKLC
jgi:ribosomal protein S18 acetylase RimI-like enzyme